ncbi:MAG: AMP-binding protein [Gammaproteobacteria bacterium]
MRFRLLQGILRATVHRDQAREVREQRRLRAGDVRVAQRHSFERAIVFANRMALESEGYRQRLRRDGIRLPITRQTWDTLPILTKSDFRQDTGSWFGTAVGARNVLWTFTSGSTGEPFEFPLTHASQIAEAAGMELNLEALGWRPPMRRATIKLEPPQPKGLHKLYGALVGGREIGFRAADMRLEQVGAMVERLRRERISFLRGYAASVYLFADAVSQRGLHCPIPLIVTLGEGLSPRQAKVIERAFQGKVYRDYGGSEAMHMGFECREQSGYHLNLAQFHLEVLRDGRPVGPGEAGDIVVTTFRNSAMPLVRYRIGDIGRRPMSDAACACGNRFPMLAEVLGRSADLAVTANGYMINLNLLDAIFRYAFEHVTQYQMIQKEPDRFDVLWVARHDRAAEHLPPLQQELAAMTGGAVKFDWQQVTWIPPERSGKHRGFIPLRPHGTSISA